MSLRPPRKVTALGAAVALTSLLLSACSGASGGRESIEPDVGEAACDAALPYVRSLATQSPSGARAYGDTTNLRGSQGLYQSSWTVQLLAAMGETVPRAVAESLSTQFVDMLEGAPQSQVEGLPTLEAARLAVEGLAALGEPRYLPKRWLEAVAHADGYAYAAGETPTMASESAAARIYFLSGEEIPAKILDRAQVVLTEIEANPSEVDIQEWLTPALAVLRDGMSAGQVSDIPTAVRTRLASWRAVVEQSPTSPQQLSTMATLKQTFEVANLTWIPLANGFADELRNPSGANFTISGSSPGDPQVTLAAFNLGLIQDRDAVGDAYLETANPHGWVGALGPPTLQSTFMAAAILSACGEQPTYLKQFTMELTAAIAERLPTAAELYQLTWLLDELDVQLSADIEEVVREGEDLLTSDARSRQDVTSLALILLSSKQAATPADIAILTKAVDARSASLAWMVGKREGNAQLVAASAAALGKLTTGQHARLHENAEQADLFSTAAVASTVGLPTGTISDALTAYKAEELWVLTPEADAEVPLTLVSIYSGVALANSDQLSFAVGAIP